MHRLIWNRKRTCPFAVLNQLDNGKYNLISDWFDKISKKFLCIHASRGITRDRVRVPQLICGGGGDMWYVGRRECDMSWKTFTGLSWWQEVPASSNGCCGGRNATKKISKNSTLKNSPASRIILPQHNSIGLVIIIMSLLRLKFNYNS